MNNQRKILVFISFFIAPVVSMERTHSSSAVLGKTSTSLLLESTPRLMAHMGVFFKYSIERLLVTPLCLIPFFEAMKYLEIERRDFDRALTCTFVDTPPKNGSFELELKYAALFTSFVLSTTSTFILVYKRFLKEYEEYLDNLLHECSLLTVHDFFKKKKAEDELRIGVDLYKQWRSLSIVYFSELDYNRVLLRLNKIVHIYSSFLRENR